MVAKLLFLMALLITGFRAAPTSAPNLTVSAVTLLPAVRSREPFDPSYLLSSDSSTLAWLNVDDQLCLLVLPSTHLPCRPLPVEASYLRLRSWSPDNQFLLLTDGVGEFSGHYIYALDTNELVAFAQDQNIVSSFVWQGSDDAIEIAYMAYLYEGGVDFTLLHRYSVLTGEDTIFDPRTVFDEPLLFYGVVSVSADATQYVTELFNSGPSDFASGLWRIDTDALHADPLVTSADLQAALPPEAFDSGVGDMVWDQERNRLLIPLQSRGPVYQTFTLISIDLQSGALTPLLTTDDALALIGGISFNDAYMTPDAEYFFYLDAADDAHPEQATVYSLSLSSPDLEPVVVLEDYEITCPRTSLLVTLQQDDAESTYLYEPRNPPDPQAFAC